MKPDSIFSKIFKNSNKSLNPGDILYYKKNNLYWVYVDNILEEDGTKKLLGINAMEYMKRINFDSASMYKVVLTGDIAVFHYKFEHIRIPSEIEADMKSGDAIKIKSLSEHELAEIKVFLYKYKNEKGKES